MSRTLTAAVTAAVALPITQPGYFVEINFSTPVRMCSRATLSWSGNSWTAWDIRLSGFGADGTASAQSGTLTLGNTDLTLSALVLGEGVADRTVSIWKFYGTAPATADPVKIFAGVGDDAAIDADSGVVTIRLRQEGGVTSYSPRRYMTKESGFNFLPPEGSIVTWNGETIRLTPEGI